MNKISVIVPVYNTLPYLDRCVESIVSQADLDDFEIILVDDGSTDGSSLLCDRLAEENQNIVVIHQENKGLMNAWKTGVIASKGDFIGFVDADDSIEQNMYATLLNKITEADADCAVCSLLIQDSSGHVNRQIMSAKGGLYTRSEIERVIFPIFFSGKNYQDRGIATQRVAYLFRRGILMQVLPFCDERVSLGEDLLTAFSAMLFVDRLVIVENYWPYHYYFNNQSMAHRFDERGYEKTRLLNQALLNVNQRHTFDFSKQINTDTLKILMLQLDIEMVFSGKTKKELRKSMKKLRNSEFYIHAFQNSEWRRLPIKFRAYLLILNREWYGLLLLLRSLKPV